MKAIFYFIILLSYMSFSQNNSTYTVTENGMMTANPKYINEFETGVFNHNNKYHTDGQFGSRIYQINNGPNYGKYLWVMGPIPWSAFDDRPQQEGHDEDWNKNIEPYTLPNGDQNYWRFYPDLSNFPKDFTINKALVDIYDIKRNKKQEALELMNRVKKVIREKYPEESYGVYFNEFPDEKEGIDLMIVSFYQKSEWLNKTNDFQIKYEEVQGKGSFVKFKKDWTNNSNGKRSELWSFREDLSGIDGEMKSSKIKK